MEGVEPIYAAHARRITDLQQLFDVGERVQSLVNDPAWLTVTGILDAEIADIDARLDGSRPLEHVEYAHLHGQRRGLRGAREAANAIRARYVAVLEEQRKRHEGSGESGPER